MPGPSDDPVPAQAANETSPRNNYLETVLSSPIPVAHPEDIPAASGPASMSGSDSGIPQLLKLRANNAALREFDLENDRLHFPVISHHSPRGMFCIDCNNCGRSIANEHYHCSICESGDYDLCPQCIDDGASCRGESHWLIKRVVQNGIVTNSTTETIPPRRPQVPERNAEVASEPLTAESVAEVEMKAAFPPNVPDANPETEPASTAGVTAEEARGEEIMCNGCCRGTFSHSQFTSCSNRLTLLTGTDENSLVRCNDCEDYDLCLRCLLTNKHGHHPAHTFHLGSDRNFCLKNLIMSRCLPGRQFKHAAICDGCEKVRNHMFICFEIIGSLQLTDNSSRSLASATSA